MNKGQFHMSADEVGVAVTAQGRDLEAVVNGSMKNLHPVCNPVNKKANSVLEVIRK